MVQQKHSNFMVCLILFSLFTGSSRAHSDHAFDRIVVFGDSLSDPGNAYFLSGISLKPPYSSLDEFLVPGAPYARGGNRFSNGKTWVEAFAAKLELADSVGPAFKGENRKGLKMSNYAIGGARARNDGQNVNLATQIGAFLSDAQGEVSTRSLYVVAFGGNDLRDAIGALSLDSSGLASAEIIATALSAISDAIIALHTAGAKTIMVANAPDLSATPALQKMEQVYPGAGIGASILSAQFNSELDGLLNTLEQSSPGLEIIRLDIFQIMQEIISEPEAYGLYNVEDACVMPNQKPSACKKPNNYFFWDGIHPTRKAHRIFARKAHKAYEVYRYESEAVCLPGRRDKEGECSHSLWL